MNLHTNDNLKENNKDFDYANNNNIKDDSNENIAYFRSKRNEEFINTEKRNQNNENTNTNLKEINDNIDNNENNDEIFDKDFITNVRKINPSKEENINKINKEPLNAKNDYYDKELNNINNLNNNNKEEGNILYQTSALNNEQNLKLNNINNEYKYK